MAEQIHHEDGDKQIHPNTSPQPAPPQPASDPTRVDDKEADVAPEAADIEDGDNTSYTDGPAVFSRTKDGRRRNPRHVGNEVKLDDIDYKKITVLSRFVDNRGRIYSRRKTRVSAKMQRKVTKAIKRARHLALMPYTGEHVRITRKHST